MSVRRHGFTFFIAIGLVFAAGESFAANARQSPNPAFWRVESASGKAYIFGSYHILRSGIGWLTPPIVAGMSQADEFVFEAAVGKEDMVDAQAFIDTAGRLPEGQSLRDMLSPDGLATYQDILRSLPLDAKEMDRLRPWLAALTLSSSYYHQQKYSVVNGADVRVMGFAMSRKKPVIYLETPRQQLEFIANAARDTELSNFEALVASFNQRPRSIEFGISAWVEGDVDELSMRLHRGLRSNPAGKRILLDDRNHSWSEKIGELLQEPKTYFITVGIGHLGGPNNVIGMLCQKGFKIERVKTGTADVPPACEAAEAANALE